MFTVPNSGAKNEVSPNLIRLVLSRATENSVHPDQGRPLPSVPSLSGPPDNSDPAVTDAIGAHIVGERNSSCSFHRPSQRQHACFQHIQRTGTEHQTPRRDCRRRSSTQSVACPLSIPSSANTPDFPEYSSRCIAGGIFTKLDSKALHP